MSSMMPWGGAQQRDAAQQDSARGIRRARLVSSRLPWGRPQQPGAAQQDNERFANLRRQAQQPDAVLPDDELANVRRQVAQMMAQAQQMMAGAPPGRGINIQNEFKRFRKP